MAKKLVLIKLLAIASFSVFAQNPIVPAGIYIADPSARVWNDGKIYAYGSLDESPDYYCSHWHYVLSSSDMCLDNPWSASIGTVAIPGGGDGIKYTSLSCKVNNPEGVRAVWLRFSGEGDDLFDVDWFPFKK